MTEEIKILLIKKNINYTELANKIGYSPQNLYNKMKRDNFSTRELEQIAAALNMQLEISFKDSDDEISYIYQENKK